MSEDSFKDDRPVREVREPLLVLALVVDVSAKMQTEENGIKRIDSLNNAINSMIDTINEDARLRNILELGIFIFGEKDRKHVYQGFRKICDCEKINLQANDNSTYVVDALNTAVDCLRERIKFHHQYSGGYAYRPYLIFITDSVFFDYPDDLNTIAEKVRQGESEGKLNFFCLGFEESNKTQLEMFTNNSERVIEVKASNLAEFFRWLVCDYVPDYVPYVPYVIIDRMEVTPIEIPPLEFYT